MRAPTLLYVAAGLLLIALSLPLIARRVPPNSWYGVRVPKSLNDAAVWYPANAFAGRLLLGVGVVTLVTSLVFRLAFSGTGAYTAAVGIVVGVALLLTVALSLAYLRRLPSSLCRRVLRRYARLMARVIFMGSPHFAVPSLRALVAAGHDVVAAVTQPDREAGRGRRRAPPSVKEAAEALGLPVLQPATLRRAEAVVLLVDLQPDLIVVAAYGQILRRAVLEIPRKGVLNVHASLLPRHRGASPVTAAILAGDQDTGVSIMLLDEGLDTGPVLATQTTPILETDTAGTLTDRLATLGASLLVETVPGWMDGRILPRAQDDSLATYAPRLDKDAGRIDWSRSALDLWRRVRAFTPWPGAYTTFGDLSLRLLDVWPMPNGVVDPPGTVLPLPPGATEAVPAERPRPAFAVATGDGLLLPLKVQRAGKRPLFADQFLRGERELLGSRLGV